MQNCSLCKRSLTTRKAIETGMGRECRKLAARGELPKLNRKRAVRLKKYSDNRRSWLVLGTVNVVVTITPLDEQVEVMECRGMICRTDTECDHKAIVREEELELSSRRAAS